MSTLNLAEDVQNSASPFGQDKVLLLDQNQPIIRSSYPASQPVCSLPVCARPNRATRRKNKKRQRVEPTQVQAYIRPQIATRNLPATNQGGGIEIQCENVVTGPPALIEQDLLLRQRLEECAKGNAEYWSFRDRHQRSCVHAYFRYPAMMVPGVLKKLISVIVEAEPNIQRLYDPFVGSGTVLGEAMLRGLNFFGQDINPLSILICRAKIGPFDDVAMAAAVTRVLGRIETDQDDHIEVDFTNREKWFFDDCSTALSKIRRSICQEQVLWMRRFFWVALAETVRLVSNSRTSTYKLHVRSPKDLENRRTTVVPIQVFGNIVRENLGHLQQYRETLEASDWLTPTDQAYINNVAVRHGDSSVLLPEEVTQQTGHPQLLVTSPPYGDNQTTVPYGQAAYLPLQWIPLEDIDESVTAAWLETTGRIDTESLGGRLEGAIVNGQPLRAVSPSFASVMDILEALKNKKFAKKVAAFCFDLYRSSQPIIETLEDGSPMIWIVGNRTVGGQTIPLDRILAEILAHAGATEIATLRRSIFCKRMAAKNASASTMDEETILVWRKARRVAP